MCTRAATKEYLELGKELGYNGAELQAYVEENIKREQQYEKEKREQEARIESEKREREIQYDIEKRKEETEREMARLQLQKEIAREQNSNNSNHSSPSRLSEGYTTDPTIQFHLDPFAENGDVDIDDYLQHFEQLAISHDLPEVKWPAKICTALRGTALSIFSQLPPEDRKSYQAIKTALFRHYTVTAESYRKRFRSGVKARHDTYAQHSTKLEINLNKWLNLSGFPKTYEGLTQLFLLEQVRNNLPPATRQFVDEQGAKTLEHTLQLADQYTRARENNVHFSKPHTNATPQIPKPIAQPVTKPNSGNKTPQFTNSSRPPNKQYCHNCKSTTHHTRDCRRTNKPHLMAISHDRSKHKSDNRILLGQKHPPVHDLIQVNDRSVRALYDTGLDFHCVVSSHLVEQDQLTDEVIQIQCASYSQDPLNLRIAHIRIKCPYVEGTIPAAIMEQPLHDVILGSKYVFLGIPQRPIQACPMTTRSQTNSQAEDSNYVNPEPIAMRTAQQEDNSLKRCFGKLNRSHDPPGHGDFVIQDGLLYRQHREENLQLVIPEKYREQILKMGHDISFSGHTGVGATLQRITTHYYWPGVNDDVKRYVQSCALCQRKSNRPNLAPVTLGTMPIIGTPFERVAVDIVGPLNLTKKKNMYILTLIDCCTMWPEAIALPRIDSKSIAEALLNVFTRIGFPHTILTDNGSNLCGKFMQEVYQLLQVHHITTSVYHPQSNGQIERFNGTLVSILKKIADEKPNQWDMYLAPALYSYRETPHSSTGMAPATLLFGRPIAGPLEALKVKWTNRQLNETAVNAPTYVQELKARLKTGWTAAAKALRQARLRQAKYYNRKAKDRSLQIGEKVLILLPQGNNKLEISWRGPYQIIEKLSRTNYRIQIGRKIKTYHINLLKKFIEREPLNQLMTLNVAEEVESTADHALDFPITQNESSEDVIIDERLTPEQKSQIEELISKHAHVLTDKPGLTNLIEVSFTLNDETPICSRPYPVPLSKEAVVEEEIRTLLEAQIISHSTSAYSAPIILLRKPNGEHRLCVDFRKLNAVMDFQVEPLPSHDRIFANLHHAKYFTKLDLSKGYYQIPVPVPLRKYLAFSTPRGHYEFNVLPFGLHVAPSIFSRMMTQLLEPLQTDILHFLDDCLIASATWKDHIEALESLFQRLSETRLTARPTKCQLGFTELDFLGHHINQGNITPQHKNLEKMNKAPRPVTKKDVRSFIGMCGYYQKFIPKFNLIASPLSELTKKSAPEKIVWSASCENAFQSLKTHLVSHPILQLPNPDLPFTLRTDAAKTGLAACLLQPRDSQSSETKHPIAYASRKIAGAEKNYSTVELECLAIVWAIQKFQLYLYGKHFTLETDNQPMLFLASSSKLNAKLMRWSLILQQYSFRVVHIKGSDNHIADYLSRHPVDLNDTGGSNPQ